MSLKSRGWIITWNSVTKRNLRGIKAATDYKWFIGQLEVAPKTGKVHLQGAVWYPTPRTLGGVKKKWPGAHLIPADGTPAESRTYCTKVESRLVGKRAWAYEGGVMPMQVSLGRVNRQGEWVGAPILPLKFKGARTDVRELLAFAKCHSMTQCWEEYPEAMFRSHRSVMAYKTAMVNKQTARPDVYVYYGDTETGKSWRCMIGASGGKGSDPGDRDFYVMNTPTNAACVPWMDGYDGEEDVILEDFDGSIHYRILLRMLDQYRLKMQVKGGMVEFCAKRIWISSNKHPREWYDPIAVGPYEGGPLERRLIASTGHVECCDEVWEMEDEN